MTSSVRTAKVMLVHHSDSVFAVEAMIENPFETQSDTFYFVGDKMIIHNKAEYKYEDK